MRDEYFRRVPERVLVNAMVKPAELPPLAPSAELPRELSPLERWHWILGSVSPLLSVGRVRVEGSLSVDQLREALAGLQARHPLLRAAVETDKQGRKPRFVAAPVDAIPLRVERSTDPHRWAADFGGDLLRETFDFGAGPLLRAVLVSHPTQEVHDVLFAVPCLVADADGVLSLLRESLELVAQQVRAGEPAWTASGDVVVPGLESLLPSSARGLGGAVRTTRAVLGDQAAAKRRKPQRVAGVQELPAEERLSGLVRDGLGAVETAALLAVAEARGVHPRAVVGAALARALAETAEPAERASAVTVGVMQPVRDRLASDGTIPRGALGSYGALVAWIAAPSDHAGLWALAREAQDRADAAQARGDDLAGLALLKAICPPSVAKAESSRRPSTARGRPTCA